ncbi:Os02g0461700 [Oryza sativa Japonica Group]|jgi:hypothetical protein|uniref:Os02g0461700 protein n=5 Tax=Oryza TaxID=4527 RepID=A0A0P0VIP8_ORYSJ|nr:hypothetical protein EE612_011174 [Oryza sativa]BAS78554.1 Os02g0461700 [Oryza sativa Japonica Group]
MEQRRTEGRKAMESAAAAATSPAGLLHGAGGSDELGHSSRVYRPASGRVPFEWEDEPGKPKSPPPLDAAPPLLCPSPAMQSARLTSRGDGGSGRRGRKRGKEPELDGCLPVKLQLGRAMKRWHLICFFRGE